MQRFEVTYAKTIAAIEARNEELRQEEAATGWHAQGAMKRPQRFVTTIITGDQDDVDRFVNEHLAHEREITVRPL